MQRKSLEAQPMKVLNVELNGNSTFDEGALDVLDKEATLPSPPPGLLEMSMPYSSIDPSKDHLEVPAVSSQLGIHPVASTPDALKQIGRRALQLTRDSLVLAFMVVGGESISGAQTVNFTRKEVERALHLACLFLLLYVTTRSCVDVLSLVYWLVIGLLRVVHIAVESCGSWPRVE